MGGKLLNGYMAKWLNCCGEAVHLLLCNYYAALLTYSNTCMTGDGRRDTGCRIQDSR